MWSAAASGIPRDAASFTQTGKGPMSDSEKAHAKRCRATLVTALQKVWLLVMEKSG